VRAHPELAGTFPSPAIAEEIETPGPGRIRGFVTYAGNPASSTPNATRLDRAFASLEFMVSVDYYINETTRHANLIFPPCSPLERSHFDLVMPAVAVRNTIKYSDAVLEAPRDARDDYDILTQLAARIAARRIHAATRAPRVLEPRRLLGLVPKLDSLVDVLVRTGAYGDRFNPTSQGLNLARVRSQPHGIDLGPLRPAGRDKVRTRDGRVDLAPEVFVRAADALEATLAKPAHRFVLVGRRHLRSNNSWMHNLVSLTRGPDRTALLVNSDDARELGLRPGDRARVTSTTGSVVVHVEPTTDLMRGVISLPHCFGQQHVARTMRVAGALGGVNVNVLTDDQTVEAILGDSVLNGVPVSVERAERT
jgi:anaerobic selenocysteine-containing dehydrogenase